MLPYTVDISSFNAIDNDELLEHIQAETITRKKRKLPAPLSVWQAAFDEVLMSRDKIDLPLSGNGYLLTIAHRMADSTEAKAERQKEEALRHRPKPVETVETDPDQENRKMVRDMESRGFADKVPEHLKHLLKEKPSD
jgi:hypothetical protein